MSSPKTQSSARPISGVRDRFPIFERLTYVNSCSQGALSDAVRAAYDEYLSSWDERGAPWDYWVERTEAARASFAALIEAEGGYILIEGHAGLSFEREWAAEAVEVKPTRITEAQASDIFLNISLRLSLSRTADEIIPEHASERQ